MFFALMAAPAMDAPELSVTVPVMLAVAACPRKFLGAKTCQQTKVPYQDSAES
jgi:hypothetical protein